MPFLGSSGQHTMSDKNIVKLSTVNNKSGVTVLPNERRGVKGKREKKRGEKEEQGGKGEEILDQIKALCRNTEESKTKVDSGLEPY